MQFALVVDDFGVKFVGSEHAQYSLNCLTADYEVSAEWKEEKLIG